MIQIKKIAGVVEFTQDMAQTLADYFDTYSVGGVVSVEIGDDGSLWLPNKHDGSRQFLGLARPPAQAKFY